MRPRPVVPPDMVDELRNAIALSAPAHLREGLEAYVLAGRPTGGFLEAVISGDLFDAAMRADPVSLAHLGDLVMVLIHFAPADCYGTREKYEAWIERGREERRAERRGEC